MAHANCGVRGKPASMLKCLSVASTGGNISSSDIGALVVKSSQAYGLALGTSDYQALVGYVAAVPSTGIDVSSTAPFYVQPFIRGGKYEMSYSTLYSTVHPATTDIGKYVGVCVTSTDRAIISMNTLANSPASTGSTGAPVFRINGYSTAQRKVYVSAPVIFVGSTVSGAVALEL